MSESFDNVREQLDTSCNSERHSLKVTTQHCTLYSTQRNKMAIQ